MFLAKTFWLAGCYPGQFLCIFFFNLHLYILTKEIGDNNFSVFIFLVRKYWQEKICISILDKRIFCIYIGISILGKRIFVFPFVFLFPAQPAPSVCSPVLTEAFPSHRSDLISTFPNHSFSNAIFPNIFSNWFRLQGPRLEPLISTCPPLPFFPSLRWFIPFPSPFFFSSPDQILSSASLIK